MFTILAVSLVARGEEKAGQELLLFIESQLSDLTQFTLAADSSQVGPHGPIPSKDEPGKPFRVLGWATYGVSAADAISTEVLLGSTELNSLQHNPAIRIGVHAAHLHAGRENGFGVGVAANRGGV